MEQKQLKIIPTEEDDIPFEGYFLKSENACLNDPLQSQIMEKLVEAHPEKSRTYTWDDVGTSELLKYVYGDCLRYCPQYGSWYIWDGSRWARQTDAGVVSDMIQTFTYLLLCYCNEVAFSKGEEAIEEYRKYCRTLRKNASIKNIIEILKTMVRLPADEFDANPYLLNTPICAYDLRTMKPIKNREDKNLTQVTSCNIQNISPTCTRWYQFVDEIMSHNKEKAAFLQRAMGYSLLGINRNECMFVAYGMSTRNGKGTLTSAIQGALGKEYANASDPGLVCESGNKTIDYNSPQPALRKLVGVRFVTMSEAERGSVMNSSCVKAMTGRDVLTTRGLYESSFDFMPQFTLWLSTNYLPAVTDNTVFKSKRVWVITFDEHFGGDGQDTNLKELFAEYDSRTTILKWLIDGCRDYFKQGLNPPQCVIDATEEYHHKCDRIGNFIRECCVEEPDAKVKRSRLAPAYRAWCARPENCFKPVSTGSLFSDLELRGYDMRKYQGEYYAYGIRLTDDLSDKIMI